MENLKTMMLCHHAQLDKEGNKKGQTFRMVPVDIKAPYVVAEWDLTNQKLVVLTKDKKQEIQVMPKVGENGEYIRLKNPSKDSPGIAFEKRSVEEWHELHLDNPEAVESLIKLVCINQDFPYQQFLSKIDINQKPNLITTLS